MRNALCLAILSLIAAVPAGAAPLSGVAAGPGGAAVAGTLRAAPGTGAGEQVLDLALLRPAATAPITAYDVELTKRLHAIAISADFRSFLHEHAEQPDASGHFRLAMTFPHAGVWHVYADATPSGLGQQVLRFELDLGGPGLARPSLRRSGLDGKDGRYGARFAALDLRAGHEAELRLTLLRDGKPAPDVTPYLGVAAHAVFIDTADLSYLHAHAAPAGAMHHDMPGMEKQGMEKQGMEKQGTKMRKMEMQGMEMPLAADAPVDPMLALHVEPPRPGAYALWVQFMAGGAVRTVPFVVAVR